MNLTAPQVASNMLGARARAAEYHAAKAASARQQANKDAEEQYIPKPAPIALSAYAKIAAGNRNRGVKNFVPLVLSEEEEWRSACSIDADSELRISPSPQLEFTNPPRPASLPPPQTLNGIGTAEIELERAVQTPYRYRESHHPHHAPFAPRAMLADNGFAYPLHAIPSSSQWQAPCYRRHDQELTQQQLLSMHHVGWFTPCEQYATHHPYIDTGSAPVTPLLESQLQSRQEHSYEPTNGNVPPQEVFKELSPTEPSQGTPKLGWPELYVFGPDDVSPTKIEMKHQARERYFAEHHPPALPTSITAAFTGSSGTPELTDDRHRADILPASRVPDESQEMPQQVEHSSTLEDLLIDRSIIASVRQRAGRNSALPHAMSALEQNSENLVKSRLGGSWSSPLHSQDLGSRCTEGIALLLDVDGEAAQQHNMEYKVNELLASMRTKQEPASVTILTPPELRETQLSRFHTQIQTADTKPHVTNAEQVTDLEFPLVDMNSSEWLEIRLPNIAERDHMRRIRKAIKESSVFDKHRKNQDGMANVGRAHLEKWIEASVKDFERKEHEIGKVVKEMRGKWERGGPFRLPGLAKSQAERQASTVKAVGSMIAAIGPQMDGNAVCHFRGSRPYCQPPEYAIERSVGLGRRSEYTSLFDSEGDTAMTAPPRLARDPRFRPQLAEGLKLGADELGIPRFFAARRAI